MEHLTSFASVPAIMAICWLMAEVYRWAIADEDGKPKNRKAEAFVPILCGLIGLLLGVITYYQNPAVIHSDNVLAAAANGITSGLASAGVGSIARKRKAD